MNRDNFQSSLSVPWFQGREHCLRELQNKSPLDKSVINKSSINIFKSQLESRQNPAQKQCVCGGSEFAINILKKIGLISEKSRAVPKLESKVYIIVI